jgi:flagellar biosynthesis/type III secretory pathway chaperone
MDELFQDLTLLLSQEALEYRKFLELLTAEEAAVLQGKTETVQELTKQKETLALELKVLEEARTTLMGRLGMLFGQPSESLTLSVLIDIGPEQYRPALIELRQELQDSMAKLNEVNRRNGFLLERALAHIRGALSLITTLVTQPPTYEPTGRLHGLGTPIQAFDHRV